MSETRETRETSDILTPRMIDFRFYLVTDRSVAAHGIAGGCRPRLGLAGEKLNVFHHLRDLRFLHHGPAAALRLSENDAECEGTQDCAGQDQVSFHLS